MKFLCTLLISIFLLPLASAARSSAVLHRDLPPVLVRLASKAGSAGTWPELRRYSVTVRNAKVRALAYFVLGYREYQSEKYDDAEADLAKAMSAASPIADLAEYYRASAAYKGGHPERVADVLADFDKRYPGSTKRYDAIELLAWGYLQTGQPQKALQLLLGEPQVRERPALALVLAQAYTDNGQLRKAAETLQDIYYAFPTTPQANAAEGTLEKLRSQLGVNYPPVSDRIATARVERLYAASRYSDALNGYEQLLRERQNSTWAWRWDLGRAKCLIRLGRGSAAIETLVNSVAPTPELDAERLATLVDAYAQIEDDTAIVKPLNNLSRDYFKSHWHAVALLRAANYFMYRDEWDIASLYYRTLREAFPQTPQGSEASWQYAWIAFLTGNPYDASKALLNLIQKYPGSPHVPAAIYFLGRLEENVQPVKAEALYVFLKTRYRHAYYAQEASRRLALIEKHPAKATAAANPNFSVAELTAKIPAVDQPDFGACLPTAGGSELATFDILEALDLDDLARLNIQAQLNQHPNSPVLVLALSQFESRQGKTDRALHTARRIAPDYYSQRFSELPREFWQLVFPSAYVALIRRYSAINHLDPYLVMGLIRQESGFNRRATSPSNARGLMQVVPSTVTSSPRYRRSVGRRLYQPAYNVRFGCAYLRDLLKRYDGNLAEAVAAYNAGPTRVDHWLSQRKYRDQQEFVESIPFPETRVYLKAVFADSGVYRQLVTGSAKFSTCPSSPYKNAR